MILRLAPARSRLLRRRLRGRPQLSPAADGPSGLLRRVRPARADDGSRRSRRRARRAGRPGRPGRWTWRGGGRAWTTRCWTRWSSAPSAPASTCGSPLARLQEARSLEFTVTGGFVPGLGAVPNVDLAAGGGRGSGTNTARGRVPGPLHSGTNTTGLQEITQVAGFDSAWEIDFFGHFAREVEAARADTQASIEARNAVLISVVADVVRTYVEVRGPAIPAGHRPPERGHPAANAGAGAGAVQAGADQRPGRGAGRAAALRHPLDRSRRWRRRCARPQRRVAVLVGEFPDQRGLQAELDKPVELPAPPPQVAAGMPVDLLRRRPDIRRAERRLASATALVGVATADLFPRVAHHRGGRRPGAGARAAPRREQLHLVDRARPSTGRSWTSASSTPSCRRGTSRRSNCWPTTS